MHGGDLAPAPCSPPVLRARVRVGAACARVRECAKCARTSCRSCSAMRVWLLLPLAAPLTPPVEAATLLTAPSAGGSGSAADQPRPASGGALDALGAISTSSAAASRPSSSSCAGNHAARAHARGALAAAAPLPGTTVAAPSSPGSAGGVSGSCRRSCSGRGCASSRSCATAPPSG